MNRYWIKIALGACLVFAVGLVGWKAVREGKARLERMLWAAGGSLPVKLGSVGFRMDGNQVGEVSRIQIDREAPEDIGTVVLHVTAKNPADLDRFRNCVFTVDGLQRLDDRTNFGCQGAEAPADWIKLGEVVFEPEGLRRGLYLSDRAIEQWRQSDLRHLDATIVHNGSEGVRAEGEFGMMGSHKGVQQGTFNLRADQGGTVFTLTGDRGEPLVDFRADEGGLHLTVRDKHGKNVLRMLADSAGFNMKAGK